MSNHSDVVSRRHCSRVTTSPHWYSNRPSMIASRSPASGSSSSCSSIARAARSCMGSGNCRKRWMASSSNSVIGFCCERLMENFVDVFPLVQDAENFDAADGCSIKNDMGIKRDRSNAVYQFVTLPAQFRSIEKHLADVLYVIKMLIGRGRGPLVGAIAPNRKQVFIGLVGPKETIFRLCHIARGRA